MSDLKPLKSSLLQGYSYNADLLTLDVVFQDGTEKTYLNVQPPVMSQVFDSPGSVGSKFLRLIAKTHKSQPTAS